MSDFINYPMRSLTPEEWREFEKNIAKENELFAKIRDMIEYYRVVNKYDCPFDYITLSYLIRDYEIKNK